jgi:iron(III) transport system substrate-binding protein
MRTNLMKSRVGEQWLERGLRAVVACAIVGGSLSIWQDAHAQAGDKVLNLYSARHYQTDEALYENFTKQTGIKLNRIELGDEPLLQRLKSEGANSPADVILLVDAARLWRAQIEGLFLPVQSKALESAVPANLRANDGSWFGFSTRARVVVYNKAAVKAEDVDTYEELADPKNKGKVCTRSGSHPYNLSLFGAVMQHLGEPATEAWLKGMVANMARAPKGGDTDQIKAVASGECQIALTNTYYLARMMRSSNPDDRAVIEKVGVVFPNQSSWGTHVNIAGAGIAKNSPNRTAAQQFLEYLAGDQAQAYFADGNNEWPVVASAKIANPALEALGPFKSETIPVAVTGMNQAKVQQMLDRVGYK